jgi:hypothetical protein
VVGAPARGDNEPRLFATGKHSIVVARSLGFRRWTIGTPSFATLPLVKPPFEPAKLELDSRGHGSLQLTPYRRLVTGDDGATWTYDVGSIPPVTAVTPDYYDVSCDGNQGAVLPGKLHNTVNVVTPYVIGADVMLLRDGTVHLGKLGEPAKASAELFPNGCKVLYASGVKDDVTLSCSKKNRLSLTHWNGRKWQSEGSLETDATMGVAGPDGWALAFANTQSPMMRLNRRDNFAKVEPALEIRYAVVDRKRRVAYALAVTPGSESLEIWKASLDSRRFALFAETGQLEGKEARLTVNADGRLTAYAHEPMPVILHFAPSGALLARYQVPLAFLSGVASHHALGQDIHGRLWESADGGATFTRVSEPIDAKFTFCDDAGCTANHVYRSGWALPPHAHGPLHANNNVTLPASDTAPSPSREAPQSDSTRLTYDCVPVMGNGKRVQSDIILGYGDPGAFSPFRPFERSLEKLGFAMRFAYVNTQANGTVKAVYARNNSTFTEVTLLDRTATAKGVVFDTHLESRGLLALRFTHDQGTAPDDPPSAGQSQIELGWFDAQTGKVTRAVIAQASFAELPRELRNDGLLQSRVTSAIFDEGLAFYVFGANNAWFVDTRGIAKPIELPGGFDHAASPSGRQGAAFELFAAHGNLLLASLVPNQLKLARSASPWSEWQDDSIPWSTDGSLPDVTLLSGANSPALLYRQRWVFPLSGQPNALSPHPLELNYGALGRQLLPCKALELEGHNFRVSDDADDNTQSTAIRVSGLYAQITDVSMRVDEKGGACAAALLAVTPFENDSQLGILLSPHDPEHAIMIVAGYSKMDTLLRQAKCKASQN